MRREVLAGGVTALVADRLRDEGFLVAFTERTGGVSEGTFASLNLGLMSGDDRSSVEENRRRLTAAVAVDRIVTVRQVHGASVVAAASGDGNAEGDGMVTDASGVALVVLAADCVPIALADPSTGRLAVVHAGWRGMAAGILDRAAGLFAEPDRVLAAIGPAIGADHYEVSRDVAEAVSSRVDGGAVLRRRGLRPHLDLPATAARHLGELGVTRIDEAETCTACEEARFYSHRRDGGVTGRQALVAVRRS